MSRQTSAEDAYHDYPQGSVSRRKQYVKLDSGTRQHVHIPDLQTTATTQRGDAIDADRCRVTQGAVHRVLDERLQMAQIIRRRKEQKLAQHRRRMLQRRYERRGVEILH